MDVPDDFGALLRRFREARNLSQSKLATRSGYDHSFVSRLESGTRQPTDDAVNRLADVLEVTPAQRDILLSAAGFMPRQVSSLLLDEPEAAEVVELLTGDLVPEEYRVSMRQVLHLLAQQARMASAYGGPM